MASESGMNTAEYRTMVDNNVFITNSLKANLVRISEALHREGFIPQAVVEEMGSVIGIPAGDKAVKLRGLVADKVNMDAQKFYKFCTILEQNEDSDLAGILRKHCLELKGILL